MIVQALAWKKLGWIAKIAFGEIILIIPASIAISGATSNYNISKFVANHQVSLYILLLIFVYSGSIDISTI